MQSYEEILATEYSFEFDKIRQNMMVTSYYKYGPVKINAGQKLTQTIPSLEKRLQMYKDTGNLEYLADVANMAMIEYMYPQHPNAHYTSTDSHQSPGLVGLSINEAQQYN